MKKLCLKINWFLLFTLAITLTACTINSCGHDQINNEQIIKPAEGLDISGVKAQEKEPEEKMNQPNENNTVSDNKKNDHEQATVSNNVKYDAENDCQVSLFSEFEEISIEQYIREYGEDSLTEHPITAVASLIGIVSFDQTVLSPGFLKPGCRINLSLFGETAFSIDIDNITEGAVKSIDGSVFGSEPGYFVLTVSDNKVLATLEMYGLNTIYLIRYNSISNRHYIFQSPIDMVEILPD